MENKNRTLMDYFTLYIRGLLVGGADVVPGVSGGTMAFILGIYDELIDSIRSVVPFLKDFFRLKFKQAFADLPWKFLLPLGLGVGTSILSLASFMEWALEEHPSLIFSVFFGLIIASIYVVRNRVKAWDWKNILIVVIGAIFAYVLVGLTPTETPNDLWFIFLSGAIAICAMILPGISGAFILVLLGKYQFMISALTSFDIPVIIVFIAGAATGILTFANILRWLLDHYHDATVAVLIGFMLGSLRKIWPWKDATGEANILPAVFDGQVALAIGLMLAGFALVIAIEMIAERGMKDNKAQE